MRFAFVILLAAITAVSCSYQDQGVNKLNVYVSILPQKFFVEQIAMNKVHVRPMILPGHNPVMFEPTPSQMKELSQADLFFRIGVPFEDAWLEKLQSINPKLEIIDTREGITLRNMETFHEHHDHAGQKDPHVWLSPALVKIQAKTISETLKDHDPDNREFYEQNLERFITELDSLHEEIKVKLHSLKTRSFIVFHPSWGYFAEEFGLKQIPIEIEGKSPSPMKMTKIMELARSEDINVVFVQKQFNSAAAKAVAEVIDGEVVQIDPLAENYFENMREIVRVFTISLNG